ncbi:MAG: InlB B-repeat-containing protein, partial [Candidatus Aenigmatarchaeota archaeon]
TDSNVGSGSRASVTWNGLGGDKVYEWYAVAEDSNGTSAESSTWSFTTMEKQGPFSPSDPEPADGATGVDTSPTLSVYVEHENGTEMDVSFYDASDDSLIGTDDNVASGDRATVLWQGLDDLTTYEWYTEAADDEGMSTQSATWSFETVFEPEEGAYELMGYFVESHDGEAKFFDGAEYYGNISVVEFENPDNVAINEDTDGSGSWQDPYGGFAWNAEGDDGWSDSPPDFGNNIYYVNEVPQADVTGEAAYVWSATREVDGDHVASPQESMVGQYEPLPTPIESSSGEDWIEIGVDSPAYTDWDNDAGESPGMGTYDEFVSYSVFVQGEEYEDWTHLGETESVPEDEYDGTYDDPIEPWNEDIDPESVTTGMNSFNASSLGPGEYQFMVRMNIGEGLSGGYAGGYDDAYTTWGSGAPSETMEIEGEQYTLDISVEGEGSIEVDGEAVETPYSEEYWEGTEVDLTAVPAENWEFDGWTGDVEDTTDQVTVTMDEDKSLTANFVNASVEHELSIDVAGEGSVEVDGEAVETPYTEQYTGGTEVDLTAVPAENWQFDGWTGDVEDSTDQITVTMDEDKSLTANFVNASVEHELSIDVEGEGSVEVDGQAVESPFSEAYPEGMTLDIEALPEGDWQFSHWIGDHPSEEREEALIEIEMDEDKSLTAYFEKVDTSVEHELTIDVEGEGTTDPEPGTHTYYDGKAVPITATPDDGWILDEWTGDIGGTEEDVTVVMDSDKSITAHFEEEEEPGEPYFEVTITSPEDGKEFEKGEEVIVEYEVENTGDAEDMQDLEFLVEDDLVETKEDVSLAPGDTDDGYFVWEADGEGEVNLVVRSINDEETVESTAQISITVEDEGGTGSVIESEVCSWWWLIPVLLIIIVLIIILLVTRRGEEEEEELPDEEPYGSPAPPPPTGRYESEDEFGEAPPSPEESEFVEKDEQAPPTDEGEFGEGSEEETFEDEGSYEEPGQGEEEPIEEDEEL